MLECFAAFALQNEGLPRISNALLLARYGTMRILEAFIEFFLACTAFGRASHHHVVMTFE